MMNEQLHNLLNDPNVQFFLAGTPRLLELITQDEHPIIKKLRKDAKAELLAGNVLVLDKRDVYDYVTGKLDQDGTFLFQNGDIRVVGIPAVKVSENNKGSST